MQSNILCTVNTTQINIYSIKIKGKPESARTFLSETLTGRIIAEKAFHFTRNHHSVIMWWKVNRCTENSLHYWMTSLYSLLTSYMSNSHASEGRTTRNVWHSRLLDDYHQFLTLFVLVFVVKGQGTQEKVYTLQYELILILIRMIFKHCEHNFFWRVFTGIPLLFFLTAPLIFTLTLTLLILFLPLPLLSLPFTHSLLPLLPLWIWNISCIPIFHRLWTSKIIVLIVGIQIGSMFQ